MPMADARPRRYVVVVVPEDEAAEVAEHLAVGLALDRDHYPTDVRVCYERQRRFLERLTSAMEASKQALQRRR